MGGDDSEENLTPPISIALHAEFHKDLWIQLKHKEDYIAWKCLSGRITDEQARLMSAKLGQDRSAKYKESRKVTGEKLQKIRAQEACSRGGKVASKKLVEWQQKNRTKFIEQCSRIGKAGTERKKIPHEYLGVIYASKQDLQKAYRMSNTGFYGKLKRGEIKRIEKLN